MRSNAHPVDAATRNMNAVRLASDAAEVFTCGVQFADLAPIHYALLQNTSYETPIADLQKIA